MPVEARSNRRRLYARWALRWALPLALYLAVAIPLAIANRHRLDHDTVAYARRAMYLAAGDLKAGLSAYWGPMLSALAAPLVKLGVDPLDACHAVLVAGGALWVVAVGLLLRRLARWPDPWHALAMAAMALLGAGLAVRWVTPDLLLSALLLACLAVTSHPALLRSTWLCLLAGLLGGLAYLAKSFALPFLLLHLPMAVALRWVLARGWRRPPGDALRWRRPAVSLLIAFLGLAFFALPWIALISKRHGGFTIGTSGPAARALLAPERAERGKLRYGTYLDRNLRRNPFAPPRDPYISWWENPDHATRTRFWSPFENDQLLRQQKRILTDHRRKAVRYFLSYDALGLGALALLVSPLALVPALGLRRGRRWRLVGVWLILAAYLAPFTLVWFVERYVASFVPPLLLLVAGLLIGSAGRARWPRLRRSRPAGALRTFGVLALAASFAFVAARNEVYDLFVTAPDDAHRQLARQLNALRAGGIVFGADNPPVAFVCFFADRKYVRISTAQPGVSTDPSRQDVDEIDRAIANASSRPVLLIWDDPEASGLASARERAAVAAGRAVIKALVERPTWRRAGTLAARGQTVRVYVRPTPAPRRARR